MHYMVYVLCNRARTLFFVGVTRGFTDEIFDDETSPSGSSLWSSCTQLVHHRRFARLEPAIAYVDALQRDIQTWSFREIEDKNRLWRDLSPEWIHPSRLLSFQVIRNSYHCSMN